MGVGGKMLTYLGLLGVALAAALAAERVPAAAVAAVLLAAWAWTRLPDLDLVLGLGHRSGFTHSLAPAGIAALGRRWWPLAAGVALGLGLHLSADLFPNAMRGYATVKLPGMGSIGAAASYAWYAVNGAAALLLGFALLRKCLAPELLLVTLSALAMLAVVYLFSTDGGWWALSLFGAGGWYAGRRVRPDSART